MSRMCVYNVEAGTGRHSLVAGLSILAAVLRTGVCAANAYNETTAEIN